MNKVSKPSKINNISLIFGVISSLVFFFVMGMFGSPYDTIHKIDAYGIIPPIWLWKTTTMFWSFLVGFAAGKIIFDMTHIQPSIDIKLYAYRGGLFCLSAFFLSLCHYPLFFNAEKIFISLIVALIAVIFSAICATLWTHASRGPSLIMFGFSFWLLYVVIVNFSVFFRI